MTDKEQIIIDGVDVAGCKYFNRFRNICHNKNLCCDCEKNQDCHYKQLKRKEQECEKLKAYAQRQENQREEYYKEYLKLSQEYEELKSIVIFLAGISYSEHSIKLDICSLECFTLKCVNDCISNNNMYDLIRNRKCKG